jgi:hypothetical protein
MTRCPRIERDKHVRDYDRLPERDRGGESAERELGVGRFSATAM